MRKKSGIKRHELLSLRERNMNWYRRILAFIKRSFRSGEFWIMNGSAVGAGDEGDYNHEAHVIETVQQQIMDGEGDWEQWKKNLAQGIFKKKMKALKTPQEKQQLKEEYAYDIGEFVVEGLQEMGVSDEDYAFAEGKGDARKYGMQKFGWKRLQGDNVETWKLDSGDLREIANGLYDAYQDDVETETFNIYVYSTNKWFNEIPWEVISGEDVSKLMFYDSARVNV